MDDWRHAKTAARRLSWFCIAKLKKVEGAYWKSSENKQENNSEDRGTEKCWKELQLEEKRTSYELENV